LTFYDKDLVHLKNEFTKPTKKYIIVT